MLAGGDMLASIDVETGMMVEVSNWKADSFSFQSITIFRSNVQQFPLSSLPLSTAYNSIQITLMVSHLLQY